MKTKAFAWVDSERGERIEAFVHDLTTREPLLMQEVLALGFGDLSSWTDTGVVVDATCGCLVGTCAIAAARLGRVDPVAVADEFQAQKDEYYRNYGPVPTTLAKALARGQDADEITRVGIEITRVGIDVADEAYGVDTYELEDDPDLRQAEVCDYLTDLIATDLRLLGLH